MNKSLSRNICASIKDMKLFLLQIFEPMCIQFAILISKSWMHTQMWWSQNCLILEANICPNIWVQASKRTRISNLWISPFTSSFGAKNVEQHFALEKLKVEMNTLLAVQSMKQESYSKFSRFLSCQTLTFDQKGIQFIYICDGFVWICLYMQKIWMPSACQSGKIEIQDAF